MDIRNKEDLWIAYSLVKLCEQHGNEELKHNAENLKRDIRKYTHRPASDRRYIDGDIDGYVAIIEFPLSAEASEEDAGTFSITNTSNASRQPMIAQGDRSQGDTSYSSDMVNGIAITQFALIARKEDGMRKKMTIDEIRNEQRDIFGDEVDSMGIMALVSVENMGWCKDGVTRWYMFTNADGVPSIYFKH